MRTPPNQNVGVNCAEIFNQMSNHIVSCYTYNTLKISLKEMLNCIEPVNIVNKKFMNE